MSSSSPFKPDCLTGKVALVTGGGSGIGYAITETLLSHGCSTVIILGRRLNFLESSAQRLQSTVCKGHQKVLFKSCDVRNAQSCIEAVEYAVQHAGGSGKNTNNKLDILVNGAAGNFLAEAKDLKPKGFKTVMEIDTVGTFNMCHAAYPYLAKSNGGCIVNISATLQYGATWYQCHASAAKSAVDSLTRSLALEWGVDGIRVVGIAPGPIANTPGTTKLAPGMDGNVIEEMIAEGIPLGRMGKGVDIGMAVVFLCCDNAGGYITGDTLVVDGGQWLYKPPMVPRDMVAELSRNVEKKSRDMKPGSNSNVKLTSKL